MIQTTRVVIVAKTRQGSGACIGALGFDCRSIRLIAADAETNEHAGLEYNIGDVWELDYGLPQTLIPPHVENLVVYRKSRLQNLFDPVGFIDRCRPTQPNGVNTLYEGLVQTNRSGALYISEETGVPPYSTTFWRPDQDLMRVTDSVRIRYRYPTEDGGRSLVFVGFQEPVEIIPAGTLLRVSLAHWWRPADQPHQELRCYVQLSGWYEPSDKTRRSPGRNERRRSGNKPDMDKARAVLKEVFGFDGFLPTQEEVIADVLSKQDAIVVMPTGGGKSLCYQLPALLFDGLTVVVSPLIALMQDQVDQLRAYGVQAAFLNSSQSYRDQKAVMDSVRRGLIKLLYVAPETLLRPETMLLLEQSNVDCLTIDEAHCISQWGHDFRPEYRQLLGVRQRLPNAVTLAVTATATERVRRDIKESLDIPAASEHTASFNRKNLNLIVQPKMRGLDQLVDFLRAHPNQSGIVYCLTRKRVDEITAALRQLGFSALPYHAGLDDETRRNNQRAFIHDDATVIVATIAFGMGIDKSNVRFVVHYDLPRDLESYYQEIGRAGRDGLLSDCLLMFSHQDIHVIRRFIEDKPLDQQVTAEMRLQGMLRYAQSNQCRRALLLDYFGETFDEIPCGTCDNCAVEVEDLEDLTVPAQKFLSCVKRTGEMFGVNYVIDVLRGSRAARVLQNGHDRLSTYGVGREYSKDQWQQMAHQFIAGKLLRQDVDHGGLRLTTEGWAVLKGRAFLGRPVEALRPSWATSPADVLYDVALFEALRALRRRIADEEGVPAYVIFHDRTLMEMATYYPQLPDSLAGMYGMGRRKVERFGPAVLEIILEHCRANGLVERKKTYRPPEGDPAPVGARTLQIVHLFNENLGITAVAAALNIRPSTVVEHLRRYRVAGGSLRADGLLDELQLPPDLQKEVFTAFRELGSFRLRPVYDALGERVSFDDLHVMRLYYESVLERVNEQA